MLRADVADRMNLAAFEEAQELRLDGRLELADLVEEQRAALGRADDARKRVDRAGERAAPVAEELALDELARHGGAVERHERSALDRAVLVDQARDDFLAGAGLAA